MAWRIVILVAVTTLLAEGIQGQEVVKVDALVGEPLGVAEVTLRWPSDAPECYWLAQAIGIQAEGTQIYFPVILPRLPADSPATLFQGRSVSGSPRRISVLFLFRGDSPFSMQLPVLGNTRITVDPKRSAPRHERLFQRWWSEYVRNRGPAFGPSNGSLPDDVILDIVARRLGLDIPDQAAPRRWRSKQPTPWELLFGPPVPDDAARTGTVASPIIPVESDVLQMESSAKATKPTGSGRLPQQIAEAVPSECFFAGCDTFSQLMWWLSYLETRQREIAPLIRLRGDLPQLSDRIRTQLGLRELPIPEAMADHFIGSIAAIGMDFHFADGAALGIVLEAKNPALGLALAGLRNQIALQDRQAKLTTVSWNGTSVSRLATPDNRIRSFYVVRGDFHLITNCQALAMRFLQCEPTEESLASLPEFQRFQGERAGPTGDLQLFIPTRFQKDLWRFDRWVESQRRSLARREVTELMVANRLSELLDENARPVSRDQASERHLQLIQNGWLPDKWGQHADGSYVRWRNGQVEDSVRGSLGTFLPVPDIEVTQATPGELEQHQQVLTLLEKNWGEPPPISVRLVKSLDPDHRGKATISVHAELAPLRPLHHAVFRQFVGEPSGETTLPLDGFALGFEWLPPDRPLLGLDQRRLVVAIPDGAPPIAPPSNQLLAQLMAWRSIPLVISSSPDDSLLMRFDPVGRLRPMKEGETTEGLLGLKRRRSEGWYSIAYDRTALDEVTRQMERRQAGAAGQARLIIADPNQSRLTDWITAVTLDRLQRASLQSARAMNRIAHDLQLSARDGQPLAALLLGAEQQCPLGGEWQWVPVTATAGAWIPSVPLTEQPSPTRLTNWSWINGLQASCELQEDRFIVRAEWTGLATAAKSP